MLEWPGTSRTFKKYCNILPLLGFRPVGQSAQYLILTTDSDTMRLNDSLGEIAGGADH
jgi:hypothetical protein